MLASSSLKRGAAGLTLLALCSAEAQLTADRMYFGVGRPVPMTVAIPAGASGAPEVRLIASGQGGVKASATVAAGPINLATVFPELWTGDSRELVYAQLVVGGSAVGPPVVLQPMVGPKTAVLTNPKTGQAWWIDDTPIAGAEPAGAKVGPAFEAREGTVRYFNESPLVYSGLRAYTDKRVIFETSAGEIEFEMRPDAAPNTAFNFLHLVEGGFYTGVVFHRVVPVSRGFPFVIQAGDPTGSGDGGPGYSIDLEPSTLPHDFGVISMARDSDPNTNGSQIFVCLSRDGTARLDGRYTAFGRAVRGADAIRAIGATPLKEGTDRPIDPPVIHRARLIDAPPLDPGRN